MKQTLITLLVLLTLIGCDNDPQIKTVSEEKPFTVQITKERSYYQAQKAQKRLLKLDIGAYLIATRDSVERQWYNVMSGAFTDSLSSANYAHNLDSAYKLKKCVIIDTRNLTDTFTIITKNIAKEYETKEHKRIEANTPDIPQDVLDVIEKFPENNIFFLEKINILNLAKKQALEQVAEKVTMDMPRGITLRKLSKLCNSIIEVQYRDNLFEDKVTISIMKLKSDYALNTNVIFEKYNVDKPTENVKGYSFASFTRVSSPVDDNIEDVKSYALALEFSQDILNSGKYDNENIKEVKLLAFKPLTGYKVGLTTGKGVYRSYFVLADVDCQYLIIAQSIEKTEDEMQEILAEVGKSKGLNDYDEFYNNFYILPDKTEDEDIFLGYSIDKLGWSYAKARNYVNWSKAMVGHWEADGYFYNTKKGLWTLSLFDLLTPSSQSYIYGNLYSGDKHGDKTKTDVYGVNGYFIDITFLWYFQRELNFGIGRYVCAINSENLLNRADMLKRAEKMQFNKGGYVSPPTI
jgi:hypothetical protein